ncbi:alpha/beta hydrolase-fold protein [Sphaerisporangium sp. NPDC051011]|uniref:alpha/beta hydrolase-fold protein n=1 Tax=Sphaerisporangium sp. NPDC051011 TaxID=3155792 RepID=UPI0033E102CF
MTMDTPASGTTTAARLLDAVTRGEPGALDRLSAALRDAGGPLLEPLESGGHLVTFVHIGPATHIEVGSQLTMDAEGRATAMERLPGTDVWHLSVPVADDRLSVVYGYTVDDPYAEKSLSELMELMQAGAFQTVADSHARSTRPDPFNPERIVSVYSSMFPDADRTHDTVLTLPGAESAPWLTPGRARGTIVRHRVRSAVFGDEREVSVQLPAGLQKGSGHPLLLLLDGQYHIDHYPVIMDNLIEAGAIPPTVVAYVHNKDSMSRMVEMSCNPDLARQYGDELLPWLRAEYAAGEDPATTVVCGASYGGLGSVWLAHQRPDLFGGVLSLSGSHWWGLTEQFGGADGPYAMGRDGEPEWLTRQLAATPVRPTRFWIAAGTLETQPLPGGTTLLTANRHLRDVLVAKGYDVRYDEFAGAHDQAGWRRTFARGMLHLLGKDQEGA